MNKMIASKWYPPEVFHINEDVTRQNMKAYDERRRRIEKRCLEIDPAYHSLGLLERSNIRRQAESEVC